MFLLFKSVDQRTLGPIQVIGTWYDYKFGFIPDSHVDVIEYRHLNPRILSEDVAKAWVFIGAYRDFISVRSGTPQNELLSAIASHEADGEKARYYLTDADKQNTVLLIKEILRYRLDGIYDMRMTALNMNVSSLEFSSWEYQKSEAEAYALDANAPTPLLSALAQSRGISVEQMVSKVTQAVQSYNEAVAELLSRKQAIEQEIKACQTIADCTRLMHNRFEISMSMAQQQDEGIEYSARFDL